MVTLDPEELDALERDIPRAEALLYKHNAITRANSASLPFRWLSMEDSGPLRHLEISRWQVYVRAFIWGSFNNPLLCPTKDGIQFNADQLTVLRYLLPLIHDDFATATKSAQQMNWFA